jgi:hypothetical protein
MDYHAEQKIICERFGSSFHESPLFMKVGISKNIKDGIWPINGLRHHVEGDTTGWYIWAGEYSADKDFFAPMHVEHLRELCPVVIKYLGLAPGYRFLLADNYEDVWQDLSLLEI